MHTYFPTYPIWQLGLVGVANIYFAGRPNGYFDEGAAGLEFNPYTHAWSLGVEEQFYFCFPLLVALGFGRLVTKTGPDCTKCVRPGVLLALSFIVSFALCYVWSATNAQTQLLAFYSLPSRFWQLMSGSMLFYSEHLYGPLCLGKEQTERA